MLFGAGVFVVTLLVPFWVFSSGRELAALALDRREKVRVSGGSMAPVLEDQEVVLVDTSAEPAVGQIVVCAHPFHDIDVIKYLVSTEDGFADLWSPAGAHSGQFGRPPLSAIRGVVTFNLSRRRPVPTGMPQGSTRRA